MLIYGSGDWFIDLIKRPQILETSFVRLRHSSKPITFIAGRHFSLFTAIFLGFVFSMIFLSDFCFFPFTSTHKPWPSSTGPRVFSLSLVAQLRFFPFDTLHNFPTSITRTSFVRHYRQKSIPEGHGSDSWKKKKKFAVTELVPDGPRSKVHLYQGRCCRCYCRLDDHTVGDISPPKDHDENTVKMSRALISGRTLNEL